MKLCVFVLGECRNGAPSCVDLIKIKMLVFQFDSESIWLLLINHLGLIGWLTLGTLINKVKINISKLSVL